MVLKNLCEVLSFSRGMWRENSKYEGSETQKQTRPSRHCLKASGLGENKQGQWIGKKVKTRSCRPHSPC